uniref:Probable 26S proteasome non-ATPase regulatory subunit 3 n=1 Tax=Piliocolobus tephrosceles TaxID=591936 RepID=A0A8C9H0I7_9PRIM
MKDKPKKVGNADVPSEEKKNEEEDQVSVFVNNLITSINYINNAIIYKDNRYILRMLKYIKGLRVNIKNDKNKFMPIVINLICKIFQENHIIYTILNKYISEYKNVGKKTINELNNGTINELSNGTIPELNNETNRELNHNINDTITSPIVSIQEYTNINEKTYIYSNSEIEAFFYILILLYLIDNTNYEEAITLSKIIVSRINKLNRRSLDYLNAKVYFYYSWVHELGKRHTEVRQNLLFIYRNACLHRDIMTQAVILNMILRDYIKNNLYDLAVKFLSKTTFPENLFSNAQYARYLYYMGKILAIQLDYGEAHSKLTQAIRKAPQHSQSAKGFKLEATKMDIIVQLLMGDIPDRSLFSNAIMRKKLLPYRYVVYAVRNGDIFKFANVMKDYNNLFVKDGVYFLIKRIHHNVIKTALRRINLSYSRISISDIGKKIGVESTLDIIGITSKAIHDGVIEATINYENLYMEYKSNTDAYITDEPMKAFHKRIAFCLQLYSDAIKAMQYPDENEKKENEEAKERKLRQQEELAQAEEGDLGDDNDLL